MSQENLNEYPRKINHNGTINTKYIDLLDEDKPVANQKFVCISFISPEKILESKDLYYLDEFLKQWDMSKSFEKYTQFLSFLSFKYSLSFDDLAKDLKEFCEVEKDNIFSRNLNDEFKNFLDVNQEKLDKKFNENNSFRTNVRGIKIRGSYPSQEEAELRCKILRELDPNHDVYVGPVGLWMPFHPEAYKTGKVEYLEDELNQLMNEKNKNEDQAKMEFDKRVKEAKEKAMEDNKKKALESGNVLTQTINKEGDLVNIRNIQNLEDNLDNNNFSAADIRKELFEGDNIITDVNNSDHGVSQLLQNLPIPPSTVPQLPKDSKLEKVD